MSISIEQLLNIPGVEVLKTEISEREISIHLKIESNYTRCHQCGEKATEYYCDGETLRLRHLPIFERPV
jgi:transposase